MRQITHATCCHHAKPRKRVRSEPRTKLSPIPRAESFIRTVTPVRPVESTRRYAVSWVKLGDWDIKPWLHWLLLMLLLLTINLFTASSTYQGCIDEYSDSICAKHLLVCPEAIACGANLSFRKDLCFTADVFFLPTRDLRDAWADRREILHDG